MANYLVPVDNISNSSIKQDATLDNYVDLGNYLDDVNKPDNREDLVRTYGDQLITGPLAMLQMVGATKTQSYNDNVQYWEEARLHKTQDGTIAATSPSDAGAKTVTTTTDHTIVTGDVVQINGNIIARATSTGAKTYTVIPYKASWGVTFAANEFIQVHKIGSEFAQGTDQPDEFELSNLVLRTKPHMITKFTYAASGSQMGNIGWVKDPETGSLYWYQKGLEDQRKRAKNYHESMATFAVEAANSNLTGSNINGAEGYVAAVEDRGIVKNGYVTDMSDIDELVTILRKQGGANEYIFFTNTQQEFFVDNMVAASAGNSQASYGVFDNREDMAVNLGFKSFKRGGITFHCKPLPILIDPKFGGQTEFYKGFMIPMDSTTDPKTGINSPLLELNIKGYDNGAMRYMEHWMEGGVNGVYTNGDDKRVFNWRSEYNLVTRAANRHVVVEG